MIKKTIMFRGDLDLKDKKKNYILIVITILLCGSLIANYFFYQQKDAAESTIKLAKVERLSNSLSSFGSWYFPLLFLRNKERVKILNYFFDWLCYKIKTARG